MAKQLTKPSKTFHDLRRGTPDEVGALKIEVSVYVERMSRKEYLFPVLQFRLIPFPSPFLFALVRCSNAVDFQSWTGSVTRMPTASSCAGPHHS